MNFDKTKLQRLAMPGVYADPATGEMHIDASEFLLAAGYPVTEANQEALVQAVRELGPCTVDVKES